MKIDKKAEEYIEELEDKIVDLSLQLKAKKNELKETQLDNYERIRKLVHNLKNPIGVAYSFAEMISDNNSNLSTEKFEKYMDVIEKSTKYSLDTLDSLGSLNRLKTPNFKLNKKNTNYNELVTIALNEIKDKALKNNVIIEKSLPEKDVYISIDEKEVLQVFSILLNNALRYSSSNSTINIKVTELNNSIETTILDEGIGISESDLDTIFNEFSKVNTYSEYSEKCIGLGLSIAKNIVVFHNGIITVESKLGTGSKFKIEFPKS